MALDGSQYDALVAEYETSLDLASRRCNAVNFFANLGNVRGLKILDLSTGTGHVARTVAKLGASKVVGVDINEGMLGKAREIIAADSSLPKDVIELELGDVFAPLSLKSAEPGSFDIVGGVWSLNYAGNQAMMDNAFRNIAKYLNDGGRFVSIITSKAAHGSRDTWPGIGEQSEWYGVGKRILEEVEDGYRVRTIFMTDPPLEFDSYDLHHDVYFRAATNAGLKEVRTDEKEKIAPPLRDGEDQAYWNRYLERPLFDVMTATKRL
jgi:toxoflavin synthase